MSVFHDWCSFPDNLDHGTNGWIGINKNCRCGNCSMSGGALAIGAIRHEICEARVGSSRHAAWVLHVIRFGLDALPANPRNRRAIIIGGSIATHLKLLEAMDSIIERFGHATMVRPLGEGVQTIGDYDFH
jgi:hypothetical protein